MGDFMQAGLDHDLQAAVTDVFGRGDRIQEMAERFGVAAEASQMADAADVAQGTCLADPVTQFPCERECPPAVLQGPAVMLLLGVHCVILPHLVITVPLARPHTGNGLPGSEVEVAAVLVPAIVEVLAGFIVVWLAVRMWQGRVARGSAAGVRTPSTMRSDAAFETANKAAVPLAGAGGAVLAGAFVFDPYMRRSGQTPALSPVRGTRQVHLRPVAWRRHQQGCGNG